MTTPETHEYILGTDAEELERLRFQHGVWAQEARALFDRAGLARGQVVLDLGSGPGFTSFELARVVGRDGRVIARDQSERFLVTLRRERERLDLPQVEPSLGPVEELELPDASLDAAYARWLFCWLADPLAVLARVARALRPGGALLLQEYVDWGAMRLIPHGPAFARILAGCLASWKAGGATIDFAAELPALAPRAGLALEHFRPIARLGRPGSPEWRWLDAFFRSYVPRVIERSLLEPRDLEAWTREWDERAAEGSSFVMTPTMADVILRRG
jgi:SAM-dependent methyltransferase